MTLCPPCAYQGGKQRIASQIIDVLSEEGYLSKDFRYLDAGCGSGSISIELLNRGIPANNLTLLDAGPWGLFWKSVGEKSFDLIKWKKLIDAIPKDAKAIQPWIKQLSQTDASQQTQYVFPILQAASFGSKAIWIDATGTKWQNISFRNYWEPTATSNRKSPVNPMMPMPQTLYQRVSDISKSMLGVTGLQQNINNVLFESYDVVYIDPPYDDTTGYGYSMDYLSALEVAKKSAKLVIISEGKPIVGADKVVEVSTARAKGGISGTRQKPNKEYLSIWKHQ